MATVVHFRGEPDESIFVRTPFKTALSELINADRDDRIGRPAIVELEFQNGNAIAIPFNSIKYLEER